MKEISLKLKCHTPWCKYGYDQNAELTLEELEERFFNDTHLFHCNNICDITFSNLGDITISFYNEITLDSIREITAILLYFISICNGFNCEYAPNVSIDGKEYNDFFSFALEDTTQYPLLKNLKFYELSLQEIKDTFGNIISTLTAPDKRQYYLALLSNFYSLMVYKDFVGNGEYKFRNIVTNLESLITLINIADYQTIETKNKNFLQELKDLNIISNTKINESIMPKGVSLEHKLKDIFSYAQKFGLTFKPSMSNECKKIAYTRNFISHLFVPNSNLLSNNDRSKYTAIFEILFRMIFLSHCGIDNALIKKNFLRNEPIRQTLNEVFDIA